MKRLITILIAILIASSTVAAQCMATTKKGSQCKRQASPKSSYCWQHGGTTKAQRALGITAEEGRCKAITNTGTQCSRNAQIGYDFCWQHNQHEVNSTTSSLNEVKPKDLPSKTKLQNIPSTLDNICIATTKKGTRCTRNVKSGKYCWQHLPMYPNEPQTPSLRDINTPQQYENQCEAITKKGTRCKRKAAQGRFCWQHASLESSTPHTPPFGANGNVLFVADNSDNLTLGTPGEADYIINREGYAVGYDINHKQPRWVAYCLTGAEARATVANREGHTFRVDPLLPTTSITLNDYRHSGYDRGHLACAGDMRWSQTSMSDSFFLSNVSPMNPSFNRGIWAILEKQVRGWAIEKEAIHIVTGPVFTVDAALPTIGENQITIPSAFYKVVYSEKPKQRAIGFLFPHEPLKECLPYEFACAVDSVEKQTGLDFFSELPDELENGVESICNVDDWFVDF